MIETWTVPVGTERTTLSFEPAADGSRDRVFLCAHGAGGHMNDRSVLAMSKALCERGVGVARFNFLYRARGSGRPDPMPKLLACLEAVMAHVRAEIAPHILVLGGRSMGGRAASMLLAEEAAADGLLLLAYPLHPAGQQNKLRVEHLPRITVPVLCVNGTRDPLCDPALMQQALAGLGPNWQMHWLEGADHSFHVLKSSGRTDAQVLAEAADVSAQWMPH